jgi:hypothetical protein
VRPLFLLDTLHPPPARSLLPSSPGGDALPNPEISAVDPYDPRRDRDPREPVDVPKREEPGDDPVEDPLEQPPIHDPGEVPEDEPVRRDPDPREPARQV